MIMKKLIVVNRLWKGKGIYVLPSAFFKNDCGYQSDRDLVHVKNCMACGSLLKLDITSSKCYLDRELEGQYIKSKGLCQVE